MRLSTDTATAVRYPRLDGATDTAERNRGFAQGHAAGYAAGLRVAAAEAQAAAEAFAAEQAEFRARSVRELEQLKALLETVTARAAAVAAPVLDASEQALAEAGLNLSEAILGTELSSAQTAARAALGRAFPTRETVPPLSIRLHPEDVRLLAGTSQAAGLVLMEDLSLQRGDAVASYPDGMVDARISTALDRARTTLERTGV